MTLKFETLSSPLGVAKLKMMLTQNAGGGAWRQTVPNIFWALADSAPPEVRTTQTFLLYKPGNLSLPPLLERCLKPTYGSMFSVLYACCWWWLNLAWTATSQGQHGRLWSSSILKCLQLWDSLILCFLSRPKSNFNKIKRKWAMIYENDCKLGCFRAKTFRKAFFAIGSLRNEHLIFPFSPVATGTVLQWKERNGAAVLPCPCLIRLLQFADFPFQIRFTQVIYA